MTDAIISQLLDFSALGAFAAFLIWQNVQMQKKFEGLVTSFQSQLKEIDAGYEKRIEIMRERYDRVITEIRKECKDKEDRLLSENSSLQSQLLQRERESIVNYRLKERD
tara:strand:- start:775 stop:1101 length:327 start_codon:yes stop_codon:yes gene_type:complete